jgi:adenosylhomocysteine nucleosidase
MSDKTERISLLICFAVREEAVFVSPMPELKGGLQLLITGMGRRNASTRFTQTLERVAPERVLTCGFAGALDPALTIGDVLYDEDFDAGFGRHLDRLGARAGTFYCSARVAVTAAEKSTLRARYGADAVEMESSVIRTLCRERGIPSATVRVISDLANVDLPLDFNALMTSDQRISTGKLLSALARSPRSIPRLLELQRDTRVAARRLADVLRGLIPFIRPDGIASP